MEDFNQEIQINNDTNFNEEKLDQPNEKPLSVKIDQANNSDLRNGLNSKDSDSQNIENKLGEKVVDSVASSFQKTWIDKYLCCLDFLKKYFNITSDDFIKRFINSLIPCNKKFQEIIGDNPDFYGPLWIFTSLIFVIAGTGSISISFKGNDNSKKNYFQKFVPVAALLIYLIGFGLPLLFNFLMKCFGAKLDYMRVICIFGYSYSVFLPVCILCSIPFGWLQWILMTYGFFSSTSIMIVTYFKDISALEKNKKFIMMGIIGIFQFIAYLFFKLYFF